MSTLFDLAFLATTPFWLLMILLPAWSWTRRIIFSYLITLPVLAVWAVAAAPVFGPLWSLVLSPSLTGLQDFAAEPAAITALWAQIIAWDLFIGRWMYLDSRALRIHPLVMGPVLVLTVLLSPLGLPLYLILRSTPLAQRAKNPDPTTPRVPLHLETHKRTGIPYAVVGVPRERRNADADDA